jgi:hypothetical protein
MSAFFKVGMRLLIAGADRALTDYIEPKKKWYTWKSILYCTSEITQKRWLKKPGG